VSWWEKSAQLLLQVMALIAVSLVALPYDRADAQDTQSGPTDTDLKASYCLGVIRSEIPESAKDCPLTGSQAQVQVCQQLIETLQNDVSRLKAYLVARGYFSLESPIEALLVPMNRGEVDFGQCLRVHDTYEPYRTCADNCFQLNQPYAMACVTSCPVPDYCQRVRSCRDLSFLPF